MKIVFSSRANTDLREAVQFIAHDKPQAARKWAAHIRKSILKLSDFPMMGRMVPEYGDEAIREIIQGQYRIVYKLDKENDSIVIITIYHAKRLLL